MSANGVEVIMQETVLVGKYFGGTLDILVKINGKIYLLDFKTSKQPSYKYFLQLSAYRYLLKELYNIDIDGCGVIILDKFDINFREYILNFENIFDLNFINHCQETFFTLVYGYYNRLNVESMFKEVIKNNESVEFNDI